MRLYLKNIGKLKEADIKLDGITVIAGENNSGKSTVGKALYAVCNSFFRVEDERWSIRLEYLHNLEVGKHKGVNFSPLDLKHYARINVTEDFSKYLQEVLCILQESNPELPDEKLKQASRDYLEIFTITTEEYNLQHLAKWFKQEFKNEFSNFYASEIGNIHLNCGNSTVNTEINKNEFIRCSGDTNFHERIIYFDDPNVLDYLFDKSGYQIFTHDKYTRWLLEGPRDENGVAERILVQRRLKKVFDLLNSVCDSDLSVGESTTYQLIGTGKSLSTSNLSTGLKTFVCLKTLLLNGSITEGSILILDEPEIHLHPEWQLVYAELIVLLQKEFKLTILLTTHSPYFLRALEVYAGKHAIADKCNYYFAKNEGQEAMIYDVSDDMEQIYEKLAEPFQVLENLEWTDD